MAVRMIDLAKRVAARLPPAVQQELKRAHFALRIRAGRFDSDEPEYRRLGELVPPGGWALDVGANVGHYTRRLSELAGPRGRVFAFEPVPATFELLAANARRFPHANVTLLNVAASDRAGLVRMSVPRFETGLLDYYDAAVVPAGEAPPDGPAVYCVPLDSLGFPEPVRLVKVDVEGHELPALRGMRRLLERDRPALIVETAGTAVAEWLRPLGYRAEVTPGSPNQLFRFPG
ncbi:MAG TPA: FkbM family methyltransferase [Longimicrobiaceae bacterium]|nr:FkbM family methyltransferase [Longimicrobiaceae bacterium]